MCSLVQKLEIKNGVNPPFLVLPMCSLEETRGQLLLANPLILMVGAEGFEPTTR